MRGAARGAARGAGRRSHRAMVGAQVQSLHSAWQFVDQNCGQAVGRNFCTCSETKVPTGITGAKQQAMSTVYVVVQRGVGVT